MLNFRATAKRMRLLALPLALSSAFSLATVTVARAAPDGTRGTAILSASIRADGTVLRGEGVSPSGTSRISTGTYEVEFVRSVTECVYSVSVGEGEIGSASPSAIGVTRRSGNANALFVRVVNPPDEASEDRAFFVLVYCGR